MITRTMEVVCRVIDGEVKELVGAIPLEIAKKYAPNPEQLETVKLKLSWDVNSILDKAQWINPAEKDEGEA